MVRTPVILCILAVAFSGCVLVPGESSEALSVLTERTAPLDVPPLADFVLRNASWEGHPVLLFSVHRSYIEGVETIRGDGSATPGILHPSSPDHWIFALSARSTHLGCTVGWAAELGAAQDVEDYNGDGKPDGRILDPCGQSQWDAFHAGRVLPRMPAARDLPTLMLELYNGQIHARGFDGEVGTPRA